MFLAQVKVMQSESVDAVLDNEPLALFQVLKQSNIQI